MMTIIMKKVSESDDEEEDEPVLAGYSQDPYADYADLEL